MGLCGFAESDGDERDLPGVGRDVAGGVHPGLFSHGRVDHQAALVEIQAPVGQGSDGRDESQRAATTVSGRHVRPPRSVWVTSTPVTVLSPSMAVTSLEVISRMPNSRTRSTVPACARNASRRWTRVISLWRWCNDSAPVEG